MDFPGGAITNIHVVGEFSTIYWRIYTEEPSATDNVPEAPTNGYAVLKHLSRLKHLELRLRSLDCLVSCYPRRLGLWVFSATPDFEHLKPLCPNPDTDESGRILVGSSTLKVSASGHISAGELVKNLSADPQSGVYSAGSQRPNNTPIPSKSVDSNFAAIYAAFISAVSGTTSLQLIRHHDAVPLGARTLFTAVERGGYASPMINNDTPSTIPSLTTLHIQLTSVGKLTISSRTVAQPGISRVRSPWDQSNEIPDIEPGTDIWLSPNGTIARLATPSPDSPASPSPNLVAGAARHIEWKLTVLKWIRNFGLYATSVEEEPWVEVEVWEPFYAKLAGDAYRQNQENQSATPLKRVHWPARYCFQRTKSKPLRYDTESASPICGDPVDFAAEWFETANSISMEVGSKFCPGHQGDQMQRHEASPSKLDFPEGIESLSRIAQYPDLQSASLVYPTPPDGPVTMGFNQSNTEAFGDDSDIGLSRLQKERSFGEASSKDLFDPDMTMSVGPSAGLVVGSGLYDANDDDLFEDLNERDFGTKGITDADFNFFDDPDFGGMDGRTPVGNIQETPQTTAGLEGPNPDYKIPEDHSANQLPAEHEKVPQATGHTPIVSCKEAASREDSATPRNRNSEPISPPLSPVEVKKILFPGPDQGDHLGKENRKQNHYCPITFDRSMSDWDRKYGSDGKFWFSSPKTTSVANPIDSTSEIPTIGIPSRSGKFKTLAERPGKPVNDHGTPSSGLKQSQRSTSASSDDMSDGSDGMALENGSHPPMLTSLKRKRAPSSSDILPYSPGGLRKYSDQEIPADKLDHSIFLGNFLSVFSDWSMVGYFSASQNKALPLLSRKEQQVQIAQILVDQVAYSSLNHNLDAEIAVPDLENEVYSLGTPLEELDVMGEAEKLDLKGFVSLQDNSSSPPGSDGAVSRQPTQRKEGDTEAILKVSPPHLRVRRGKDYLDALPPIVSFWETFGLEPAHGPKDISAYCIYPWNAGDLADAFLERFGLLYSNCNLGEHVRGERSKAFERGLASWGTMSAGGSSYSDMMQSLMSLCDDLGAALATSRSSKENIVLYIINPFAHAAALADVCAAFWQLFRIYAADVDKDRTLPVDDLVLQIIPMSFVMSADSIIVPSQAEYLSLALEVYSRCPPRDPGSSLVDSAPPVVLEESVLKGISFKLASENLSPLLEGRCLHIACSRSLDQRWITVAWSNDTGSLQRTMSYCLRFRDSNVSRDVGEVRNEIWTATRDIVDKIQARWRVVIVNTEPVDQEEVDAWAHLAEQHNKTKPVQLELVVLSVNTTSDLSLDLPSLPMPMTVLNCQITSTPAATPSASGSVPSPDQAANSPTPVSGGNAPANAPTPTEIPREAESESLLTNICDESWVVVLSHRLNSSAHLTEFRPALASAYLLRRKGPTDGDGVLSMNVNLIYSQRPPSSYEGLLRETLKMYRDLATLSRARGMRNVQQNTFPWHIAAAVRAQEMLSYVL